MYSGDPIFLVSSVRSGSTLLRLMLDSHPKITNPGECDFFFDLIDHDGNYPELDHFYDWLSTNRIFLSHELQVDRSLSYPDLIKSFADQFRKNENVLVLNVHRNFQRIPLVFPNARYIHLVRDPRDVAKSCVSMGWAGNAYFGVDIWRSAEESWDRLRQTLSDNQYLEIRYESLIAGIEPGLSRICLYLGLAYSNQMMDYAERSSYELPSSKYLKQWERKYTGRELSLVESKITDYLQKRNYGSSGVGILVPNHCEYLMLAAQNRLNKFKYRLRKYGILLSLEQLLSSRVGWQKWIKSCQVRKNIVDKSFLR